MKKILNLGCGKLPIQGAINIDCVQFGYADIIADITNLPYKPNSIDGIYMIHCLEHIERPYELISKLWYILKPGGFLYIQVPHSSSPTNIGDFGHYRTFNYSSLSDYLCNETYVSKGKLWKCEIQELHWYKMNNNKHPYIKFKVKGSISKFSPFVYWIDSIINQLIKFSPRAFERGWFPLVGGCDELVWKGIKING